MRIAADQSTIFGEEESLISQDDQDRESRRLRKPTQLQLQKKKNVETLI
jgi:hypothetical protein